MKLTKKKAIGLSIELWEWLAETGEEKEDWPEWKVNGGLCPSVMSSCFLCEYNDYRGGDFPKDCHFCPYYRKYGFCRDDKSPFEKWWNGEVLTTHKKYAKQFLNQLKEIENAIKS